MEVFQQPDTTGAVHLWKRKHHMGLAPVREPGEFSDDRFVIQVIKAIRNETTLYLQARVLVKVVIGAEIMLVQQ
jgi:hypothetical protein